MFVEYNTSIIRTQCPDAMKGQRCPLREYVEKGQDVFHVSINETYLIPNTYDIKKLFRTIMKMHQICNKCYTDNTQNTK